MKRTLFIIALLSLSLQGYAQTKLKFVEASSLTLVGKLMDTPNPYHRVDTVKYKGFTRRENIQVRCPAGMAVYFSTNSKIITVKTDYGFQFHAANALPQSYRGYDLYIFDPVKNEWIWAGAGVPGTGKKSGEICELVKNMDGKTKNCLLYLPIYSELNSCKIGVEDGASIKAAANPFRHRVVVFGSSYTHGISTSRSGMSYPDQFTRQTGVQMVPLGVSGNCKMQDYFADVLCDVKADAFVFDAFSNPSAKMIQERLFPFIEKIQKAHPGVPLIFQQTIYSEKCNFNVQARKQKEEKMAVAEKLMAEACSKYKDVYFIRPNASVPSHETTVDGTHPDNYGYTLWCESVKEPIMDILRKYYIEAPKPNYVLKLYPEGQDVNKGIALGPGESNEIKQEEAVTEPGKNNIGNITDPEIAIYLPEKPNGQMVVVCPGGGYRIVSYNNEGVYVAQWLMERGIAACVVKYRIPNAHHTVPLTDVQNAFRYCRTHAKAWGIKQIGVMGFSAGGHLAASASNLYVDDITRPDFSVLIYPVISFNSKIAHMGSRRYLIGEKDDKDELVARYSIEKQVTSRTPVTFVAYSENDKVVPVVNSELYCKQLKKCKVPYELHFYPTGGHGWGFTTLKTQGIDRLGAYRTEFESQLEKWLESIK